MLFTYPIAANADNWLHDCFSAMVSDILERIQSGVDLLAWPECIPFAYRPKLENRPKMEALIIEVCNQANALSPAEITISLTACATNNDLPAIFDIHAPCSNISTLPVAFRDAVDKFFRYGFGLLSDLNLRDQQFQVIFNSIKDKLCPFCGTEYFEAPTEPRPDLDHYLAISKYPFAGANLNNLVPMGKICNSAHKGAVDILRCPQGNRRAVLDPYGAVGFTVTILNSTFYDGDINPTWDIDLGPSAMAVTWDQVWNVKRRYSDSILTPNYKSWIEDFGKWCGLEGVQTDTTVSLLTALRRRADNYEIEGNSDRAFIKKAFFDLLVRLVNDPALSDRTTLFLRDVISNV